jgi:uncharacterized damage-inducible protein DinB
MQTEQLLDTWRIHCRINLYLLDAIAPETLDAPPAKKGRNVGQMLAHLHNVRLMWLESAAPEVGQGLVKIDKDAALGRALLRESLEASGHAIEVLLERVLAGGGKVKGFKPHAAAFLGYLIAHEAYHHGEIGIALREAGFPLDRKTAYGMWEWGAR